LIFIVLVELVYPPKPRPPRRAQPTTLKPLRQDKAPAPRTQGQDEFLDIFLMLIFNLKGIKKISKKPCLPPLALIGCLSGI
jgi:hypothetical protein